MENETIPDLSQFAMRQKELEALMTSPHFYDDMRRATEIGRERQHLESLLSAAEFYEKLLKTVRESQEILADSQMETDFRQMAEEEMLAAQSQLEAGKFKLLSLMIPPDPSNSRNTVVEIRAGTGGDEASLFVGDLFRMYSRLVELRGWKLEIMGSHGSDCGGFKEIIFLISGENVFQMLKFESGVHRVQRIPSTEANGRIHTSTATVAVLPEAEEVDIQITPDELEITVCRASGPGGQGVNTTDSAVQILHKPSGMIVSCADERSQQKNRIKALTVLRSRLLQQKQEEEQQKYASFRRNQIGSGDRSERIRTYNFPQNRLTDHRIGLTLYNLTQILDGELDEIIDGLQLADQECRIAQLLSKA